MEGREEGSSGGEHESIPRDYEYMVTMMQSRIAGVERDLSRKRVRENSRESAS
jgi:hypothetical protein